MAKSTKSRETLHTFFIWSVAIAFFAQVAQTVYFLQFNTNNAENGLWSWFFGIGMLLALWLVLFLSRTKPDLSTKTLFDVTLLTTATLFLSYSLGWLVTTFIPVQYLGNDASTFMLMTTVLYQGLPLILVAPILFVVVRRLRTTKQW